MREPDGFLSAETLGLTPGQRAAMIKFKEMGERGELKHEQFDEYEKTDPDDLMKNGFQGLVNMSRWCGTSECGSLFCIGGAIEAMSGEDFSDVGEGTNQRVALDDLFQPPGYSLWPSITPAQMTQAVTNFLTDGEANWESILDGVL